MRSRPGSAVAAAWSVLFLLAVSAGPTLAQDCGTECGSGVEDCIVAENGENCPACIFPFPQYLQDTDGDGYGACMPCTPACQGGQYTKSTCTASQDTVCEACSVCADGEEEVEPCSATTDTVCEPVTAETPPAEEAEEEEAADCSACPEGKFLVSECDEASQVDRVCRACSEECGDGVTDCIADGAGEAMCSECNFPGYEVYAEDADGDGYGECKFCSPCDDDEFVKTACSDVENTECAACSVCGDGEEEAEACTQTTDTVCIAVEVVVDCSACPGGEFLAEECDEEAGASRECSVCTECGSGEWLKTACTGTVDSECVACSPCGDGEEEAEACTHTKDTVCSAPEVVVDCSACPGGEFLAEECDEEAGASRVCSVCTECGSGEWLKTACTGTVDSECVACSSCEEGQLLVSDCSDTEDVVCEAGSSVDCSACPEGEFLVSECDEDDDEDRVCRACSDRCGDGVTDCIADGSGDAACSVCNFPGFEMYTEDVDGDGYGECKFCSPCDDNEYVEVACFGFEDNKCTKCSECGDGEEEAEACTSTTDTICVAAEVVVDCSACPDGEFTVSPCDEEAGTSRVCGGCEERCGDGVTDCVAGADGQVLCSECRFGSELYAEDTDGDGYGLCTSCTACGSGEWLKTPCSGTVDNECVACSTCEEGEVKTSACSDNADTVCEAAPAEGGVGEEEDATSDPAEEEGGTGSSVDCSACPEGEFLVSECDEDDDEDRVCRACSDRCGDGVTDCIADGSGDAACAVCNFPGFEMYAEDADGDGYGECKFCSPCDDNEYVEVACFGFEDNKCTKCSECGDGEVEVEACTATTDVVCSASPEGEGEEGAGDAQEEAPAGEDGAVPTQPSTPLITKSTTEEGTLRMTISADEGLEELYRVAFVYKGDHYDSGDLSSPSCDGPDADSGETVGVEDAPVVLDFDSQWTALAVRLCPKEEDGDMQQSSVTRAIYSACSCFGVQYVSAPCDTTTGAVAQCEFCSQCTDGQDGSMAQCRGGGVEDCLTCGGEGGELTATDGEYGTCSFVSGGAEGDDEGTAACENVCEEGYFIETPCAAGTPVVCKECTSCESDDDDDLFETKACNNTALEGGDSICGEPVDAPFPAIEQTIDGEDIVVSFSLPGGLSFDDFFIVYRVKETDDPSVVGKPGCDDDDESDDGGAMTDEGNEIKLNANKLWGIAAVTCPEDEDKGYKQSNTMKFAVISCGCPDGKYVSTSCEDGKPAECRPCSDQCPSGQFISQECSDNADVKCMECSGPCGDGEVEIQACAVDSDRVCLSEDQAIAAPPVVDSSETFFDEDSKIHLFLTLPKPLSFDDFKIAYAWVAGTEEDAPAVSCDEDEDSILFSDETIELVADEGWLVLSAVTCPHSDVPFSMSEVYTYDISACSCPEGSFVEEACVPGEQIRDCEACTVCGESDTEVSPCQGTADRVCEAGNGSGADPGGLESPAVTQVWTDSNKLQVVVEGSDSDAAEVRFALWAIESSGDLEEAKALALTCDDATSPNSTESGAISAGDSESFLFGTDAVVFIRAIACPVGLATGVVQPSSEVAMEMSLCACAPGKGLTLSCDETAKTTASCAECGIGTFLDETESVCVACSSECAAGSFQSASCTAASDISCEPCSSCGSGELEVAACTAESDTVCAPGGTPQPNIVASASDSNALEAGQPPMQASVQLPLGYPSSEWYVKYTAQVAEEYTIPEDVLASPACDGEPSPGAVDAVNQLWNAGYGYGWVLVRAVTCPVDASSQQEASAVVSEAISICSCAAGQYPTASCNILEGEKVQCETCPDSGCPPAVKPPLLSQMSAIADGETGSVKLFAGPDAVVAYTTDKDLAVPEDPCASEDLLKSTGPIASLSLPIGTNFLKAFTCPSDSSVPELFSYMLSTVVTVHPGYAPAEADEEARVSASSIVELDPLAINNILGEDTATDYIALVWSKFAQAGVGAAGVSGTAVVTGVNKVALATSPFRRLAEAGAQYKIDYEVITTASEAPLFREFLEKELVPETDTAAMTTLSQLLGGAKLVQQTTEVECSPEASKACEVQWASDAGACMLDPLEDVSCGQVKQGSVVTQPGPCGAPCPASCTEGLSCTEVTPCEDCECGGTCGTKYAVAQEGPEETDMLVDASIKEAVGDEGEPITSRWWLWAAVGGGIIVILVVATVAAVLTVRSRKRRTGEANNAEDPQNFIFSSVYEDPRGVSGKGAAVLDGQGTASDGEVHVQVTTDGARSTGDVDLEIDTDSEMSDYGVSRQDML